MWWRRLAEVQTEHQNGEERGFKWLWMWNGCWCRRTGLSLYEMVKTLPGLMSLDFCCNIQMLESVFGVKNMKAWIILPCLNGSGWWWCNGAEDIFLAHFGSLSTNWASFKHHSLHRVLLLTTSIPLWLQCTIFWCTSSRIIHHVTKLKSSQTGFLNMTMSSLYSNGLHSLQISINRAALGCGGTRDSHHGCADDKSAATVWCYHDNMDQNLWGMSPTPCWIYATKN